jgi:hypothetical protein
VTDIDTNRNVHSARESWLQAAVEVFRPRFIEIGFPLPEKVRVAVGFSPSGARFENKTTMGVTLPRAWAADHVNEIWISPEDGDTASMLETLLHELIHAALDCEGPHGKRFAEAATRLGFKGPMTETPADVELAFELFTIAASLGAYPGAQVSLTGIFSNAPAVPVTPEGSPVPQSSGPKKQTARMLKMECKENEESPCYGYTVRMTKIWVESVGLPRCGGCGSEMVQEQK